MEISEEKLLELESEYDMSFSEIMKCYTALKSIPCIERGGEENFENCLETLIQDRTSNSLLEERMRNEKYSAKDISESLKSFDYSISDALYRIYDEEALPYLCEEYKLERQLGNDMSL